MNEDFMPPIPLDKVPEIKAILVTNASSKHLYEYMERLPEQNAHQRAYKNTIKLAPKENAGRKFPKSMMQFIPEEHKPHLFAILVMFDGTAAILTAKEFVNHEER